MAYRKAYFKKDGTYVQGHYTSTRSKSFSNKNNGCLLLLVLAVTFGLVISCSESSESSDKTANSNCPTKTCGDFSTQSQAQNAFNSNRSCYKSLDADGDGIACESLPK